MTSSRFGCEAFVRNESLCRGFSAALNPCPRLREGEGLAGRGTCVQEPEARARSRTEDALPLTPLPKEDYAAPERAQDSVCQIQVPILLRFNSSRLYKLWFLPL